MSKKYSLRTPFDRKDLRRLKAGDEVILSGTIYTARDSAHRRLAEALSKGRKLPVDLAGQTIYYAGPTPAPPGKVIGSCGPTTAGRMDFFTEAMVTTAGVHALIGKGDRSEAVRRVLRKSKTIYFVAFGGLGAFYSQCIRESYCVAYKDLGPEAIYRMEITEFPVIVGIDNEGKNIYTK